MSWDVVLRTPGRSMGQKDEVRELLLGACERILGEAIPRKGPTEVAIDPSFRYEVYFIGHKRAVESLSLGIRVADGDPHLDPKHPVWSFLKGVSEGPKNKRLEQTGARWHHGRALAAQAQRSPPARCA